MSANGKQPKGYKSPSDERWISIQAKCHPAIFAMAQLWKDGIEALKRAGPVPSQEQLVQIDAMMEKGSVEIHKRFSGTTPPQPATFAAQAIFSDQALSSESSARGVMEWIHFERHKIPFKQDLKQMEARDWDASHRIQRTFGDVERNRCEKGPIQAFKGNLEHSNLFEILWGLGIERLTQEELAEFFDKYCPCGIETHDSKALSNHRERFHQVLQDAIVTRDKNP